MIAARKETRAWPQPAPRNDFRSFSHPARAGAARRSAGGQAAFQQNRQPPSESRRIGQLLALDDAGLVKQEPGEFAELLGGTGLADRGGEALDQAVARVQLEDAFGRGVKLAMLLQQAFEVHVD